MVRALARKNFVFTIQCTSLEDARAKLALVEKWPDLDRSGVNYVIAQIEIAPSTRTHHIQGYAQTAHRRTALSSRNAVLGASDEQQILGQFHVEVQRGTNRAARDYCRKSRTQAPGLSPVENGTFVGRGRPSTLEDIAMSIRNGETSLRETIDLHPEVYVRHHSGLDKLAYETTKDRTEAPKVYIYFGGTGTGKTLFARWKAKQLAGGEERDVYYLALNGRNDKRPVWWDGYRQQKVVVIDDFHSSLTCDFMMRLIDHIGFSVQIKGAMARFNSPYIIITSNYEPSTWYPNLKMNPEPGTRGLQPLHRRLVDYCKIWEFSPGDGGERIMFDDDTGKPLIVKQKRNLPVRVDVDLDGDDPMGTLPDNLGPLGGYGGYGA